ncbi:THUMP domain-containing class I SAM-dependent RNA methyltransferase [Deferrisoma sp.]
MTGPAGVEAYAVAPPGLEDVLADELRGLGLPGVRPEEGGVAFSGSREDLWRANLESAVAGRVLVRLARFRARTPARAARELGRVRWGEWLPPGARLEVRVARHRSRLHTGALAEAVREAAARALGPPGAGPPFSVRVRVVADEVVMSLDTSGDHLHRRGYRLDPGAAPLRENLAAGLLRAAGWNGTEPLLDPMAGSGTLPIEAARLALGIPPGWQRAFAFERFANHDPARWDALRSERLSRIRRDLPAPVFAADRSAAALRRLRDAARRAGVADHLQVAEADLEWLFPPAPTGILVADPPHGRRLGGSDAALGALAAALTGPFRRWRWAILTPDPARLAAEGLRPRGIRWVRHGGRRLAWVTGGPG